MENKKKESKKIFNWNKRNAGFFFFGVGVTMFLLNLITVVNAINLIASLNLNVQIPMSGYYISLITSVILMTYSLYNIYIEQN